MLEVVVTVDGDHARRPGAGAHRAAQRTAGHLVPRHHARLVLGRAAGRAARSPRGRRRARVSARRRLLHDPPPPGTRGAQVGTGADVHDRDGRRTAPPPGPRRRRRVGAHERRVRLPGLRRASVQPAAGDAAAAAAGQARGRRPGRPAGSPARHHARGVARPGPGGERPPAPVGADVRRGGPPLPGQPSRPSRRGGSRACRTS